MEGKAFYTLAALIVILLLLSVYWFIPFSNTEFNLSSNANFSLNNSENNTLQFYPNMRFPETSISYKIEKCPLKRANDMEYAFQIMEEETPLTFYPVEYGQEITITCNDTNEVEGGLFVAGEGGPTNITSAGDFNVIESGKILLIKDSTCARPNIALHELLHVLGFDHSKNPNNIMYEVSRCDQTIGSDIISFINKIYSIPTEPDLLFENASASMHGKYLNVNFSIRNNGLKYAGKSIVKILVNGKEVDKMYIPPIDIGYGRYVYMSNIWVSQININDVEYVIEDDFNELSTANNYVSFEIKK
jgi:hypothetical protein